MQTFAGVAPVTVQSGTSRHVNMRRACPHFLRQTFHEFARCSLKTSRWAQAYYAPLLAYLKPPPPTPDGACRWNSDVYGTAANY